MADMLFDDIKKAVKHFEGISGHKPKAPSPQFAH